MQTEKGNGFYRSFRVCGAKLHTCCREMKNEGLETQNQTDGTLRSVNETGKEEKEAECGNNRTRGRRVRSTTMGTRNQI